jgi:hypothetical protein
LEKPSSTTHRFSSAGITGIDKSTIETHNQQLFKKEALKHILAE